MWLHIAMAPKDGSHVRTAQDVDFARPGRSYIDAPFYPLLSRYIGGEWCCDMGGYWASYDPQPKYWEPRFDQMGYLRRSFPERGFGRAQEMPQKRRFAAAQPARRG